MVLLLWLASACFASQEVLTFWRVFSDIPEFVMSSMVLKSSERAWSSCSGDVPR